MADVRLDDRDLRRKLERVLMTSATKGAAGLQGHLQQKLNVSARVALAGGRGRKRRRFRYVGSAPGESPRKRTGTLQKSVAFEVRRTLAAITVRIGSSVPYARFLERGTRKMRPRPWLRPGLVEYLQRFQRIVLGELSRQLRGGGGGL